MKYLSCLSCLILLIISAFSSNAACSGRGNGAHADKRKNPWFLRNTAEFTWCLQFDAEHFPPEKQLIVDTQQAFDDWKEAMEKAESDLATSE